MKVFVVSGTHLRAHGPPQRSNGLFGPAVYLLGVAISIVGLTIR